jgi:hypothetical protein
MLCSLGAAAERPRQWQEGKVLDAQRSNEKVPDAYNWLLFDSPASPAKSQPEQYPPLLTLVIETQTHIYTAQQKLPWPWSKVPHVSLNGHVKIAGQREKLLLVDENGREHVLEITRTVLKSTPVVE